MIQRAESCLTEARDLWQPLHDPEWERDDQNFKRDGKEYNYRADETHRILADLDDGRLTPYPLTPIAESGVRRDKVETTTTTIRGHVFVNYSHLDKSRLAKLQTHLKPYVR